MKLIEKIELLKLLERKFGELENDCGCYVNGRWLSINRIVEIIDECCEYDSTDFKI